MPENYYDVLGVHRDAAVEEIKKAFRKLALDCHPDRHPDDPEAADKFRRIYDAYAVLSNSQKRARYDRGESVKEPQQDQRVYPSWDEVMQDFFMNRIDARTAVDGVVADSGIPSMYVGGTMEGPTTGVELSSSFDYQIEKLDTALAGLVHTLDGTRERNGELPWHPDRLRRAACGLLQEGYLSDQEFMKYMEEIDQYEDRQREKEFLRKMGIRISQKEWGQMSSLEKEEIQKKTRPLHDRSDKANDSDKRAQMRKETEKMKKKANPFR